jgi:hypothetical protein
MVPAVKPSSAGVAFAVALAAATSCKEKSAEPAPLPSAPVAEAPGITPPRRPYEFLHALPGCETWHEGLVIDFGTGAARARRMFRVEPFEDMVDAEREGATVSKLMDRKLALQIAVDQDLEEASVSVRAHSVTARSMSLSIDDKRVGFVRLVPGETKLSSFPSVKNLAQGRHVVTLEFAGRARGVALPYVELDWLRVSGSDDVAENYAAPTLRDIVTDVVLDNTPKRALALSGSSRVRCPITPSADSELHVHLGYWGEGKGESSVRLIADGEKPVILAERKVSGGEGATWTPLKVPLEPYAGRTAMLEFSSPEPRRSGRVVFGDPRLVRRETTNVPTPAARTVVILVLSGIDQHMVPPWKSSQNFPALGSLARASVVFSRYRATSNVVGAVVVSMLTGLSPAVHGLEDPAARLPKAVRGIGELVKEAGGRTAMFTAVPGTFPAFGFEQGWDRYSAFSPVKDAPVSAPIDEAKNWLASELESPNVRRLVVVHAAGVHPPWDVTKEEAGRLPPDEYSGLLDPRRGGVVLARMRGHKRGQKRLGDDDWKRLRAMEGVSLGKQDAALAQLVDVLREKNAWDSTLLVVVGDVGRGEPPELPFEPAGELDEDRLIVPLFVKFPEQRLAAKEAGYPVTSMDVATTALHFLGISPGREAEGLDLYRVAGGEEPLAGRALVATLAGHYATRLGSFLLLGQPGTKPKLCLLDVDPACTNDAFGEKLVTGQTAWQATFDAFAHAAKTRLAPREPASIDPDLGAALSAWGDI